MLKLLRFLAILEGISFLVLLLNMLVTKRVDVELYIHLRPIVGMIHGLLFLGYILLAIMIKDKMKWNGKDFFLILISSILPFFTFWVERKYLSEKYKKNT